MTETTRTTLRSASRRTVGRTTVDSLGVIRATLASPMHNDLDDAVPLGTQTMRATFAPRGGLPAGEYDIQRIPQIGIVARPVPADATRPLPGITLGDTARYWVDETTGEPVCQACAKTFDREIAHDLTPSVGPMDTLLSSCEICHVAVEVYSNLTM